MTEQEATNRWCPFIRQPWHSGNADDTPITAVNTADGGTGRESERFGCLGSGCMAWRWHDAEYEYRFTHGGEAIYETGEPYWEPWPPQEGEVVGQWNADVRRWRQRTPQRKGFCGLAGADNIP